MSNPSLITESAEELLQKNQHGIEEQECDECGEPVYAAPSEGKISCSNHA